MKHPRVAILLSCLLAFAVPAVASQFIFLPFDRVVVDSAVVVRGTIGPVSSAWDADHEVIYSSAQLQINEYLVGDGPAALTVREVGGTVAGYTQQAIGFPELREGEEVVLFLRPWEDGGDMRIYAYRQGKYVVERGAAAELVFLDPEGQGEQGHARLMKTGRDDMDYADFREMVRAAARGREAERARPRK